MNWTGIQRAHAQVLLLLAVSAKRGLSGRLALHARKAGLTRCDYLYKALLKYFLFHQVDFSLQFRTRVKENYR